MPGVTTRGALAVAAAVAMLASGCSDRDRRDDAGSERASGPSLDIERIEDAVFSSRGAAGSLADAATGRDGSVAVAVGSVVDPRRGAVSPLAIESADGVTWSTRAVPGAGADAGMSAVAALPEGGFVAAGTVTTADGVDAALWWRDPGGTWGEPTMHEALGTDGIEDPQAVAAGPAGVLVAGRLDGRPAVWTSTTGDDWALVDEPFADFFAIEAAVVGDRFVVMALDLEPPSQASVHVLTSGDGDEFVETGTLGGPGLVEVNDAAFVDDRYLAVGGIRPSPTADVAPAVWASSDGRSWAQGPELAHDPSMASNLGVEAESIAASPGRVSVSSVSGHRVWTSFDAGTSFTAAVSTVPEPIALGRPLVAPAGNPTLVGDDELFLLASGRWQERARGLVPRPDEDVDVEDVDHGPHGFVAVGSASTSDPGEVDGTATRGVVWRSEDGSDWARLPDDPDLAGTDLNAVAAYSGGYVAVGAGVDGDLDRTGRVFVSPDGAAWTAVEGDGLVPASPDSGALHSLESVAAYGDGYIAVGWGFDGTDVAPLVVASDGTALRRVDLPGPAPGNDLITLGVCVDGGAATVVGVDQAGDVHGARWATPDGNTWQQLPSAAGISRFFDCAFTDDGVALAVGDMFEPRPDAALVLLEAEAADAPAPVDALPGGRPSGQRAEAVAWLGDRAVVVGSGADDPERGAVVWWGLEGQGEWLRLAGGALGGPGRQNATGVASDGATLVVVGSAPEGGAVWRASVPSSTGAGDGR